jgi:hypothetical protein
MLYDPPLVVVRYRDILNSKNSPWDAYQSPPWDAFQSPLVVALFS